MTIKSYSLTNKLHCIVNCKNHKISKNFIAIKEIKMAEINTPALLIIIVAVLLAIPVVAMWAWIMRDRMKERRGLRAGVAMRRNFSPMSMQSSRRSSTASMPQVPSYSVDGTISNPFVNRYSGDYYTDLGSVARLQT